MPWSRAVLVRGRAHLELNILATAALGRDDFLVSNVQVVYSGILTCSLLLLGCWHGLGYLCGVAYSSVVLSGGGSGSWDPGRECFLGVLA